MRERQARTADQDPASVRSRPVVETQAVAAGVTAALLGYASSVAVVVAGLTAVGASERQVASALLALGVALAALSAVGSWLHRIPVSVAWSTPGAALLATTGPVDGGFPAVVGAFAVCGAAVVLIGLVRPLTAALQRLPAALSAAVLAGVLLPFCLVPARAVADLPAQAGLIALAWLVALRWAPRLAGPAALTALVVVLALDAPLDVPSNPLPRLEVVRPALSAEALTSIALPLLLVTMTAQNLVGVAVLTANDYRPRVSRLLVATGAGSVAVAPLGAPTVNLAAITGALTAGPGAHPDPGRRWVAGVASGATYLALGAAAPWTSAVVAGSDPRLVGTAAGLALVGALAAATADAVRDERTRVAALVTVVVTASGAAMGPVGAAPLGLVAGALALLATRGEPVSPGGPRAPGPRPPGGRHPARPRRRGGRGRRP